MLSQLGAVCYSLAMSMPHLTFFHLITQALFKALLFIAAGALIHFHVHNQDLGAVSMLDNSILLILTIATTWRLALCEAPFIAGYYSNDLVTEA